MTTTTAGQTTPGTGTTTEAPDWTESRYHRFDRIATLLGFWMVFGVFTDGWGHHHGATESFFTPWHFLLYSGYFAAAVAVVGLSLRRRRQGIRPAIPAGYAVSVAGAAVFFVGGFSDGVWHSVFGIEHKVEAFISPPHMTLFISGTALVLGPFAAWSLRGITTATWRNSWPALLALAGAVGLIQFATENDNALLLPTPGGDRLIWAGPLGPHGEVPFEIGVGWGLSAIVVQSLLVSGAVIVLANKMLPPFGAMAFVLLVGVGHSIVIHNINVLLIPVAVAGLVGDVVVRLVARGRVPAWVLPAAVPGTLFAGWVTTIAVIHHLVWSVHLVSGCVVMAAVTGVAVHLVTGSARQRALAS